MAGGVRAEPQRELALTPGVRWILGSDLLREGPLLLDLQVGRLSFAGD